MATYSANTTASSNYWLTQRIIFLFACFLATNISFAQTQTVKGNVIDEASRTPVAGAVILLQSDRQIETVSDSVGNFRLTSVPLGRQSFIINIIGYEPVFVNDILVTAGKEVMLNNVMMNESISTLDVVVITANSRLPNNEMAVVSTKTFNMDETKRYAGSIGDPARMTANFAGVISTNDTRNDIIIRGNSPNSMLWQLEGLNIPNPNHFGALNSMGGSVSMLNNNNIDKSDFIAGAFPAQYGNALAGAFDIRLRSGNDETHEFVTQVGFNGFEAGAEGPIGQKNKATYIVNARYSTLAVFQQLGLEFGTGGGVPIYADINYKVNTPVGERASVSLFGIWGRSDWTSLGKDYDPDGQAYGNDYSNRYADYTTNITGASLDYRLGKNTTAKFTLGYSSTNELFDRDSISTIDPDIATPDWHWKFVTRKYSAVLSVNHKFNAKHSIVGGLYNDYIDYSLLNKRIYGGTADAILVNRNSNIMLTQAYVQWKYRFNETFTFIPGLHYQRLDISESQSIEPRIGISARVNNNHTLGFGFGMHSQMDNLLTYATITKTSGGLQYTNESLGFLRSNHFVLSHDWRLSANTRLKTEVYYQSLYDLPVESRPSSFSTINLGAESNPTLRDSLVNEGTGRNYGLEITLERRFSKGLYYLLTTSLFDSKYKGSDRILRNTAFNMGYVVNALAGKEWSVGKKSIIGVSLKLSTVGGRYLSPIDIAASTADGEVQYVESEAFSIRQDNYFRTDIKLSYRRDYKKSSLEISLDLQNVTNNENIFRQEWNSRTYQITNNYQQGFFPVPFIRFTF